MFLTYQPMFRKLCERVKRIRIDPSTTLYLSLFCIRRRISSKCLFKIGCMHECAFNPIVFNHNVYTKLNAL